MTTPLVLLPPHPANLPWPKQSWPRGDLAISADAKAKIEDRVGHLFSAEAEPEFGTTHALLLVRNGALCLDHYGNGKSAADTFPSWSKAKSITHALVGLAYMDGLIDPHAPADVPAWQAENDPRREITLDHLLRMSSGLRFREDYVEAGVSDVIEMLFGEGKDDVAAFAAKSPLEHAPGSQWYYSSGTTNIVSACLSRALNKRGGDLEAWMRARLFEPLGMTSAQPKFDAAGHFIGSSFCYCTAEDFARFGYLYLRDGVWNGERLLPEGWVDYARSPTPVPETETQGYGAHWWHGLGGPGSFSANGYQGQYTVLVPDLDLILVRHGDSIDEKGEALKSWITETIALIRDTTT